MTEWMHEACKMLGTKEIPGRRHTPAIVALWEHVRVRVLDDETAWCSAFVNACLDRSGYATTGKANARSWLLYGQPCTPMYGAVTVFWRGSPDSWKGHVAFWLRQEGSQIWVLGGNQGNRVSAAPYPAHRLLATRWPVR
jgi:uncharacterized protein (TIGR02594 family)